MERTRRAFQVVGTAHAKAEGEVGLLGNEVNSCTQNMGAESSIIQVPPSTSAWASGL